MDMGRHLRNYYERAEAKGEPLEITINNGLHPAYFVAATTPSSAAPIDVDELAVASYLLGEPARLCRSKTVSVEGLADAQMIMEAEILPYVREPEGRSARSAATMPPAMIAGSCMSKRSPCRPPP